MELARVYPLNMPVVALDDLEIVMQVVEVKPRNAMIRTAWRTEDGEVQDQWFKATELRVDPKVLNG